MDKEVLMVVVIFSTIAAVSLIFASAVCFLMFLHYRRNNIKSGEVYQANMDFLGLGEEAFSATGYSAETDDEAMSRELAARIDHLKATGIVDKQVERALNQSFGTKVTLLDPTFFGTSGPQQASAPGVKDEQ